MGALFRRRPQRSALIASLAFLAAYYGHKWVPETAFARLVGEMVVAFIGLTALALFVIAHHRGRHSRTRLMNQTQEEIVLIGIFALFWFAFLLGLREWNEQQKAPEPVLTTEPDIWDLAPPPLVHSGIVRPCVGGQWMCVIEEMSGIY